MVEGVFVLLCALAFTGVAAWLNMNSNRAPILHWVTYFAILMGLGIALWCLILLFHEFYMEVT